MYYAGALERPGTNAEFHLVDERIVGTKPASLSFAEAAALPLTAITAWETLFDRLDVRKAVPGAADAVLIVGGAGGVGSIATQLARQLTDLTVITTASRPETQEWSRSLGAHHVVDHGASLAQGVAALGTGAPGLVFSTTHTDSHLAAIAELIAPQGRLALIDDPATLDVSILKRKSLSLHWEFMFTRPMFGTATSPRKARCSTRWRGSSRPGACARPCRAFRADHRREPARAHALLESGARRGRSCWRALPEEVREDAPDPAVLHTMHRHPGAARRNPG